VNTLGLIREDIQAALARDPAARSTLEVVLTYPGFHARTIHRASNALYRRGHILSARILSHVGRALTGIEIHPGATIGRRFFIDHGMGIVIGETTVIGDDCHIYQGVTLGGTSTMRVKRHPTLGNGVLVGAGARLIGAIDVGDNARIGAGSVVIINVPANATVVGVPGHVVAFERSRAEGPALERLPDPEWDRLNELERRFREITEKLEHLEAEIEDTHERAHENHAGLESHGEMFQTSQNPQ
jgi:serine O-acetyltransferase